MAVFQVSHRYRSESGKDIDCRRLIVCAFDLERALAAFRRYQRAINSDDESKEAVGDISVVELISDGDALGEDGRVIETGGRIDG